MSSDQKTKIDQAGDEELWRLLSCSTDDKAEAVYIRDKLTKRAQAETLRKLEEMTRRLERVERSMDRSQLGTPTFWMALMAALFASFSVPWDTVEEQVTTWTHQARKSLDQPIRSKGTFRAERVSAPEPILPDEHPSSPLSDALLLLPRYNAQPRPIPAF